VVTPQGKLSDWRSFYAFQTAAWPPRYRQKLLQGQRVPRHIVLGRRLRRTHSSPASPAYYRLGGQRKRLYGGIRWQPFLNTGI
jgi:hypothetical protein